MKIQKAIIMIKSYVILVDEIAAGGKVRKDSAKKDLLKENILIFLKMRDGRKRRK